MMSIGMGQVVFPAEEVADLSPAPRETRAAKYMMAMGLWRPQMGPGDPGPVPTSSCNACMTCRYCYPEGRLPREYCILLFFFFFSGRLPWQPPRWQLLEHSVEYDAMKYYGTFLTCWALALIM